WLGAAAGSLGSGRGGGGGRGRGGPCLRLQSRRAPRRGVRRGWALPPVVGEGKFVRPHGVTVSPDGTLYCVDDLDHTVRQYTPEGDLLRVLGTSGHCCDTGVRDRDFRTILRSGPPFNQPTNLAIAPNGDLYVTDGYG